MEPLHKIGALHVFLFHKFFRGFSYLV